MPVRSQASQMLLSASRAFRTTAQSRSSRCIRCLHTDTSRPHAFLRPLLSPRQADAGLPDLPEKAEELEGVMSLVMDRQETRNALSVRMVGELREGIAKVSSDNSARVLLLHTPHAGMFCSGADLRERRSMSPSQVSTFLYSLRYLLQELESLRIPTIAVVDGMAMGGGCELALGCDIRIGGPGTTVALPEAKLGIIPGAGGTQRMSRLVGAARAKELIYTGKRIDGEEAERIGLLNICAKAPDSAMDHALLLCRQIVTSAPLSLRASKEAIDKASDLTLEEGLTLERQLYNSLLDTEDRQEGLRAFAEKRRAKFTGR